MIDRIPDWFTDKWNLTAAVAVVIVLFAAWGVTLGEIFGAISIGESSASLVAVTITATLTGFYAILTFSLLRESIRDRHQQVAPTIVMDAANPGNNFGPVLRNVGNGPAINMRIHVQLLPNGPEEDVPGRHLRMNGEIDLGLLHEDFSGLAIPDSEEFEQYESIKVDVEYVSNTGKEYSYSRKKDLEMVREEREKSLKLG